MTFTYLTGQFADAAFNQLGIPVWSAQYRGLNVPSSTIFDQGTNAFNEATLPFMEGQNLHSWIVCLDRATFQKALDAQISALIRAEWVKLNAGTIDGVQYAKNVEAINKAWAADVAIAPNTAWKLSNDAGKTWRNVKTFGDPQVDAVRYRITLVNLGV